MRIDNPDAYIAASDLELLPRLLPLEDARVLELGCGRAWMTRQISERFPVRQLVATEVDRIQHQRNLQIADLPRVQFRYGGAEAIDLEDGAADIVLMFKSLHHVPTELMDQALGEIRRVLCPGGLAYISEPIYGGEFNQLLRMFHDERAVRQAAFDAVRRAVERGALELVRQVFFLAPSRFADFAEFERRIIQVTHTEHRIAPEVYARLRERFEAAMTADGAEFIQPHRVDLLRRPG